MPASRCAPSWTRTNTPKASKSPTPSWPPSTSLAIPSTAIGTTLSHRAGKSRRAERQLTELFMDGALGHLSLYRVQLASSLHPRHRRGIAPLRQRIALHPAAALTRTRFQCDELDLQVDR